MINEKGCALANWCDAVEANTQCALGPLLDQVFAALDANTDPLCQGWRTAAVPTVCTVQTTILAAAAVAGELNTDITGLIGAGNDLGVDCMGVEHYLEAEKELAAAGAAMITGEGDGSLAADSHAAMARTCLLQTAAKLDAGC